MKKNQWFKNVYIEKIECPDTGELGAVVWFGTKNETGARNKIHKLAKLIHNKGFKNPLKVRDNASTSNIP